MYEKKLTNVRILHDSCPKNYQNTLSFMIFAQKLTKFPNFTSFLPEKCPNFHNNCPKNIPSLILGPPCPPVSYAYVAQVRYTSKIRAFFMNINF